MRLTSDFRWDTAEVEGSEGAVFMVFAYKDREKEIELRDEIIRRVNAHDALVEALKRSQELFEKALPKFNWGSSFLNAEAIRLLNDVPIEVAKALAVASETRTEAESGAKTGGFNE